MEIAQYGGKGVHKEKWELGVSQEDKERIKDY